MSRPSARVFALRVLLMTLACSVPTAASCSNDGTGASDTNSDGGSMNVDMASAAPSVVCDIPAEAAPADTSSPTTIVGTGTPASCTEAALSAAVQKGGVVTFNCGPSPATIQLTAQIRINNVAGTDKLGDTVIDGGGRVTLNGGGTTRILYLNACLPPYNSAMCQNFDHPRLTVQNLAFTGGKVSDANEGGAAIYVKGGTLKVVNSTFTNNACAQTGQDVGGGAIATYLQSKPVYIVGSTFGGGSGQGNSGSNGGALASIGTSWTIINSTLRGNNATGSGGNPGNGGNGGAIVNDGNTYTLSLCGTTVDGNSANALGGGIFFVSNNGTGTTRINNSLMQRNSAKQGGGLYIQGTRAAISNTSIVGNSATSGPGINEYPNAGVGTLDLTNVTLSGHMPGPALDIADAITGTLTNCTIAGNATGIANGAGLGLANTIVAGNSTAACTKSHSSSGGNIQFPQGTACSAGITIADPLLSPLQDNGGSLHAPTMLPATGSPALKIGTACPATDQRGQTRPSGGCTAGALEVP